MSLDELWNTLSFIFRYSIGPIITGVVVYLITSRRKNKQDKEKVTRQLNAVYSKLKRIVNLSKELREALDNHNQFQEIISQLRMGDTSGIGDDLKREMGEADWIKFYTELRDFTYKDINKIQKQIKISSLELKDISNDLLPADIHADLMEIIEENYININYSEHKKLLVKVEKAL